jgi:hypothetical protein
LGAGGEFSPKAAGFQIDSEESIAVVALESIQPRFQGTPLRAFPQKGNAFQDFADGDNADEELFFVESVKLSSGERGFRI